MITICTVNYYADDFLELLKDSVNRNAKDKCEILVHDNSSASNIGHGKGLDRLIKQVKTKYVLVLDVDCHLLLKNFDDKLIKAYELNKMLDNTRLIAAEGGLLKPVRPCFMFFERDFFIENNMSFEAKGMFGCKFDVGIVFYFKALTMGAKVVRLPVARTNYKDTWGEEYWLGTERIAYHHWYGTRFHNSKVVDTRKVEDFIKTKESLFEQYYEKTNINNENISAGRVSV